MIIFLSSPAHSLTTSHNHGKMSQCSQISTNDIFLDLHLKSGFSFKHCSLDLLLGIVISRSIFYLASREMVLLSRKYLKKVPRSFVFKSQRTKNTLGNLFLSSQSLVDKVTRYLCRLARTHHHKNKKKYQIFNSKKFLELFPNISIL